MRQSDRNGGSIKALVIFALLVANIIVAEGAREHYELGFLEYLKFGALSTAVSLAIGVVLV